MVQASSARSDLDRPLPSGSKARAPSFTSSPLRASSSARATGSDSESSDRSEPISIPILSRSHPLGFARPSTFTPASQAGKSWIQGALDAPADQVLLSPPMQSPPSASSIKARRRSSASLLDITSHSPLRSSLVGSYEQSLLSGRMSALPSRPLPFRAELGILGGGKAKGKMKMPAHLHLDFGAVFYGEATSSPYVGAIDLEQHYMDELMAANLTMMDLTHDEPLAQPKFPGYRLPSAIGQVQLIIKNPNNTPVKIFLVPYDLSDLRPGQKTFIRQKLYLDDGHGPLQYAVHLPFCSPPSRSRTRIYLHGTVRVVFHAAATTSRLHTLYDKPEPSAYAGPGDDWLEAKQAATPFDPDGAYEETPELIFARRPVTPSAANFSGLSHSRSNTPRPDEEPLR